MIFNLLAESTAGATKNTGIEGYILIGVLVLLAIVMFVVQGKQRKKQQQQIEEKISGLSVGDKIKTIGMIMGEIVEICPDGTIVLLTGSEQYPSYVRVDKQAIYQIFKDGETDTATEDVFVSAEEASETAENEAVSPDESATDLANAAVEEPILTSAELTENVEITEDKKD